MRPSPLASLTSLPLVLLCAVALVGCPMLDLSGGGGTDLPVEAPALELQRVELVQAPSEYQLASYYCHRELGTGITGMLVCQEALNLPPAPSIDPTDPNSLRFAFDVVFEVTNPNDFPIPVVELLVELGVFEGRLERNLGAMCVAFCAPDAADCRLETEGACSTDDFPEGGTAGLQIDPVAVVEGLIDLISGEGDGPWYGNELIRTVPAGGAMSMVVGVRIGVEPMLAILEQAIFSDANWDRLARGEVPEVVIPYSLEGFLWFEVGRLGRVWVRFGPLEGEWDLADEI